MQNLGPIIMPYLVRGKTQTITVNALKIHRADPGPSWLRGRLDIRPSCPLPSSKNPGRFAPDPVRPLDVSPQRRFAPGRFAPGRFAPLVVSPLVDSPQEENSTYFVVIYVNSKCKYICYANAV